MQSNHRINRDLLLQKNPNEEEQDGNYAPMDIDSQNITLTDENENEILRLIQQYLSNHGYEEVAQSLQEKSNIKMEDNVVNDFRENVLAGNYTNLKDQISNLNLTVEQIKIIEYQLYEQYYLELMEKGQRMQAILVLQKELVPRAQDKERLHQLAQLIMCQVDNSNGQSELRRQANWKGSENEGRKELLDKIQVLMPSSSMLQPNRLEHLIKQAIAFQLHNCKFHNVHSSQYSLLEDHMCSKQMIPSKCIAVLTKHKDEVWQVKFSQSGKKMATMGKDNIVCLWSFTQTFENAKSLKGNSSQQYKYRIKCTHEIKAHNKQINSLNWSNTDDRWIITSSHDQTAKIWDSKTGKLVLELNKHQEALHSAVFTVDDTRVLTIAVDKQVILWEIKSDEHNNFCAIDIGKIETKNYLDLAISGNRFVTIGSNNIQVFNIASDDSMQESMEDIDSQYQIEVSDTLTSICLSKDGRYLLANSSFKQPKIELYDLNRREVIHKYRGHKQEVFIIRCAFGGVNESFVLCGSEDSNIYLWNKEKGDLIAKIEGHTQVINSVHWNPTDPYIFASASDDQTIRIWGLEEMPQAEVIIDSKEIKKIDVLQQSQNGNRNGFQAEESEDDDDEDSEQDEDEQRNESSQEEEDPDWEEGNN